MPVGSEFLLRKPGDKSDCKIVVITMYIGLKYFLLFSQIARYVRFSCFLGAAISTVRHHQDPNNPLRCLLYLQPRIV